MRSVAYHLIVVFLFIYDKTSKIALGNHPGLYHCTFVLLFVSFRSMLLITVSTKFLVCFAMKRDKYQIEFLSKVLYDLKMMRYYHDLTQKDELLRRVFFINDFKSQIFRVRLKF